MNELRAIDKASAALESLDPVRADSRDEWIRIGLALHGFGDAGLALWDEWSQASGKYRAGECASKWATMKPRSITVGSLIAAALEDDRPGYLARLRELEEAGGIQAGAVTERGQRPVVWTQAPAAAWQAAGLAFVAYAQARLWDNADALDWLRGRGLADEVIKAAGLGWNPATLYRPPEKWGLEPWDSNGKPGQVWLPRGWVIPWLIGGQLWNVKIRRTAEDLEAEAKRRPDRQPVKYVGPRRGGASPGLYNADTLDPTTPAILVEGELDALLLAQTAGDLVAVVATGGTGGARCPRWIAALAACPVVLVALDADLDPTKGDQAAAEWIEILPNARRLRPWWGDAGEMHQAGADLRGWVLAGLGSSSGKLEGKKQVLQDLETAAKMAKVTQAREWAAEAARHCVPCPDAPSWDAWLQAAEADILAGVAK